MTTHYPKAGKGRKWTVAELRAVPTAWHGDTLSDGEGLTGDVRVTKELEITIRFRVAFKWNDKLAWHACGTWPTVSMEDIRRRRDAARDNVRAGVNPNDARLAAKIEAQQKVEAVIAAEVARKAEDATNNELIDTWLRDGVLRKDKNLTLGQAFDNHVRSTIGQLAVRETTEHHLRTLLRQIVEPGYNRTAVIIRNDLAQMYHWAEKRQPWRRLLAEGNPIDLVDIRTVLDQGYNINTTRKRVLSHDELRELNTIFMAMDIDAAAVDRHELFEMVWRTPILQLSQQLGISDRGLSKLCERRNVPTPPRGHWQRLASGKKPKPRPALPDPEWNPWVDLVRAHRGLSKRYQCAIWLCLSTTCRVGELLLAETAHVDLAKREWFIPAENVKATRGGSNAQLVQLSDFALRQFEILIEMAGTSRWVFPSPDIEDAPLSDGTLTKIVGDRQLMFKELTKEPNNRIMDNSLVLSDGANGEWTPHDMRRTSATMMQALGVDPNVIDRCQNHVLAGSGVRRHYMLHQYADEKRVAWAKLGAQLEVLFKRKPARVRV